MKKTLLSLMMGICLLSAKAAETGKVSQAIFEERSYWLPEKVTSVEHPVLSLSGKWELDYALNGRWKTVQVPGELAMQGYAIEHDKPFMYRKSVGVPTDYRGKRIILRFDGVYSYAKLFINGKEVREHWGGFSRWETDVTSYIKTGKKNEIKLEVTDRLDEISYASGYAHHPIGGILRDVTLFALPDSPLYDASVETDLDSVYCNADLRFRCMYEGGSGSKVEFSLKAPDSKAVSLSQHVFPLVSGENEIVLPVRKPQKWDAEHPNLYTLNVKLIQHDGTISTFSKKLGFREVEIVKNQMLVNGRPVKLRGACRHDMHPELGRTTSAELDSLDVLLFKEANMNFVRTSHYPPTERFLEFCDRYGIYVESETAVCFVNTHRQKNYAPAASQNDSVYAHRYLGQCKEMVKSFCSHPSILFWSIGNESVYGTNFQMCYDWVKATDRTRPVIFSYPGSVEKGKNAYDILSMHYQDVSGNLWQWDKSTQGFQSPEGIPALFDEWAHPACYTYETLRTDPNIREFWGKSLDMMWSGLFDAPGGLGGAIWGYIDETFALPEPKVGTAFWEEFAHTAKPEGFRGNCVGYGEWGIVDVWRRKKPEFWATKKAYSPIKLLTDRVINFTPGQPIRLTIYNRFDHTNLNEVKATYTYGHLMGEIVLGSIQPHAKGMITIPAADWEKGKSVLISYYTSGGELVDTDKLVLGEENIDYPERLKGGSLAVSDSPSLLTVIGDGFEVPFDKETGLITNAKVDGEVLVEKGPYLNAYINLNHLSGAEVRKMADRFEILTVDWKMSEMTYQAGEGNVYVKVSGTYKEVKACFDIKITSRGELSIAYSTEGLPNGFLREIGLEFCLPDAMKSLKWKRKGYWNYYPEGELASNEGEAELYNTYVPAYGVCPRQPWALDTHNYYYWADKGAGCERPLTQRAKGMKENIYYYTLSAVRHQLSVISPDASVACRINKTADEELVLYTNNRWDYPEIAWGNYCKTLEALPCYGEINLRLK